MLSPPRIGANQSCRPPEGRDPYSRGQRMWHDGSLLARGRHQNDSQPEPIHMPLIKRIGAFVVGLLMLLAPALWNGFPLLQYDTGGYLARWYEGYLVPSRSTLFGLFLHLGEGFHFWPELVLQSGCTIWVIWLALRAFGLGTGPWRLAVIVTGLSLFTAVSVLSSTLLTDIFAGLAVLSLHLV